MSTLNETPTLPVMELGSLSSATLCITLFNVLGEVLLILYFLQKSRKSCSTLLFLLLVLGDLSYSVTGIFSCFEISRYRRSDLSASWMDGFRLGNSIILGVTSRFSVVVICVLSVVKLMVIIKPFFKPSRRAVIMVLMVCSVSSWTILVVPYSFHSYSCSQLIFSCLPAFNKPLIGISAIYLNITLFEVLPFLIPSLLVLTVALITLAFYFRLTFPGEEVRQSYFTVLLYSVAFLLTTLPHSVAAFIYYQHWEPHVTDDNTHHTIKQVRLYYTLLILMLHVRASLTVLLLITRSSGFRHFFQQMRQGRVRLHSFVNPDRDRAIQVCLRDKAVQEQIRRHVNSNPAVSRTALNVRWDRKVRVHRVRTRQEADGSSATAVSLTILPSITEDSMEC